MINFVISPSQQTENPCKMGDNEESHMYLVGQELLDILSKYDGINPVLVPQNLDLIGSIRFSNAFVQKSGGNAENSRHLELHSDAGAYAKGSSAFHCSEAGKQFITPIFEAIANITPTSDIGVKKRTDLGALNQTTATAGLIEVSFHDNMQEAKWIHENIKQIARTIADVQIKQFNLKLKSNNLVEYEMTFHDAITYLEAKKLDSAVKEIVISYAKLVKGGV